MGIFARRVGKPTVRQLWHGEAQRLHCRRRCPKSDVLNMSVPIELPATKFRNTFLVYTISLNSTGLNYTQIHLLLYEKAITN